MLPIEVSMRTIGFLAAARIGRASAAAAAARKRIRFTGFLLVPNRGYTGGLPKLYPPRQLKPISPATTCTARPRPVSSKARPRPKERAGSHEPTTLFPRPAPRRPGRARRGPGFLAAGRQDARRGHPQGHRREDPPP